MQPEHDYIAINSMEDGVWGAELSIPHEAAIAHDESIIVWMTGPRIYVNIQGRVSLFYMNFSSDNHTLYAAGKNISYEWRQAKLALPHRVSYLNPTTKSVSEVKVSGRVLKLGSAQYTAMAHDLLHECEYNSSRYIGFLGSRILYHPGDSFTIIDADQRSIYLCLAASILFPHSRIMKVCTDEEAKSLLQIIMLENRVENIELCGITETVDELREGRGAILLQGSLVFDLMGDSIEGLSSARKSELSIYSEIESPVQTGKVSQLRNLHLQMSGGWALQLNGMSGHCDRKRQLDVIVAAYNAGAYIVQCIGSILDQTRDDVRVIVVDDGSKDNTRSLLDSEFGHDERLTVLYKENGGCASARNYGRLSSLASHIAFVDADDFVSPGFFSTLYDLANYSGCEIVQGGFDFYDASKSEPYRQSYEEEYYKNWPRTKFGDLDVLRIGFRDMAAGQPSIWRRVYRRDFLDSKSIFFRESIRAYDDYSFQLLSTHEARDAVFVPSLKYHYRQHPDQDVKSGDVRHFNMVTMFHDVFASAVANSWDDVDVFLESMSHSLQWSISVLEPHLKDQFMASSAKLCARIIKSFGKNARSIIIDQINHPNFDNYLDEELARLSAFPAGAFWPLIAGELSHPDMLRMRAAARRIL
ncbi:glycosyltransferase family 2 protein [Stagnihabitans tardus]|uniref:glycosyltransferase family 2 protein n=1 Tax=Stagnihabitans tardus TaxID=2699202 RepID=UPI003390559C